MPGPATNDMLALLLDVLFAWLLVRFVPAGWKQILLALFGGWLAALAGSVLVGLAFGWSPVEMLSRLTVGLLVHPVVVGGLVWLLSWLRNRRRAT